MQPMIQNIPKDKNKENKLTRGGNREELHLISKRKIDASHLKKKEKKAKKMQRRKSKRGAMLYRKGRMRQSARNCSMRVFKMSSKLKHTVP